MPDNVPMLALCHSVGGVAIHEWKNFDGARRLPQVNLFITSTMSRSKFLSLVFHAICMQAIWLICQHKCKRHSRNTSVAFLQYFSACFDGPLAFGVRLYANITILFHYNVSKQLNFGCKYT